MWIKTNSYAINLTETTYIKLEKSAPYLDEKGNPYCYYFIRFWRVMEDKAHNTGGTNLLTVKYKTEDEQKKVYEQIFASMLKNEPYVVIGGEVC